MSLSDAFARGEDGVWVPLAGEPVDFGYSDGAEVEQRMLAAIRSVADRSLMSRELLAHMVDWPTTVHFSPLRANLLRPLALSAGMRVLEIGAGCGVLTRYLGEQGCEVVAVEGSHLRATIAATRTADLPSCRVVCCDFNTLELAERFDLVLLIGVLEYAEMVGGGEDPYVGLLRAASAFIDDDGALMLAIENRFGLKYLAGAPEDHLGLPYVGVSGGYPPGSPSTFTRDELSGLLTASGLSAFEYLVPLPDYKLVSSVVRFETAPVEARESLAQIVASSFCRDRGIRGVPAFSLEQAGAASARGELAVPLACSFLVAAGGSEDALARFLPDDVFAWYYSVDRAPAYAKITTLRRGDGGLSVTQARLEGSPEAPAGAAITQRLGDEPLLVGKSVWLEFVAAVNRERWSVQSAADALADWADALAAARDADGRVPDEYLDFAPFNAVSCADGLRAFDLEWVAREPIPYGWVVLRGVLYAIGSITSVAEPMPGTPITTGGLAEALTMTLLARHTVPYEPANAFFEWLTGVQSTASGCSVAEAQQNILWLWESRLKLRTRA